MLQKVRLQELDFLRGLAIILVLFRHIPIFPYMETMGWIGVDLFFVLSGFLVSGLLFKEYIKFGNIQPKLFLIRRGFKIYPIYYLSYCLYLIPILFKNHNFNLTGFLADITFTQNYLWRFGYAYPASWSLAIEEHFYLGFALLFWIGLRYNKIILRTESQAQVSEKRFDMMMVGWLVFVFLLRLCSNIIFPENHYKNFSMTHLRIDSLLFGVLISYFYYFKNTYLRKAFLSNQYLLAIISVLCLSWTPFIEPIPSFFVKTIGFSLLYIAFGILLIFFLLKSNINHTLNRIFSASIVAMISKIGYCSYSIYIIHSFVIASCNLFVRYFNLQFNQYFFFFIASTFCIIIGMIMTYQVETHFLRIRDKYYPSRV